MKKFFLMLTVCCVLITSSMKVNAQTVSEQIFKLSDVPIDFMLEDRELIREKFSNIIDIQEISLEECKNIGIAEAYEYNEDNDILQELDVELTLNKIICKNDLYTLSSTNENTSTYYALTARAIKPSSDSLTQDGITVSGTIYWEDNLGPINNFVSCSGSRSGAVSGDGYYQVLRGTATLCHGYFSGSSFSSSADSGKDTTGTSFQLIVRSNGVQVLVKTNFLD